MKDIFYIFLVLLVLLIIISTLGGSIRKKENFYEVTKSTQPPAQLEQQQQQPLMFDLPKPPPEIESLLKESETKFVQPEVVEPVQRIQDYVEKVQSYMPSVASMAPPVTSMGLPQVSLPEVMPNVVEPFLTEEENLKQNLVLAEQGEDISPYDNVQAYSVF